MKETNIWLVVAIILLLPITFAIRENSSNVALRNCEQAANTAAIDAESPQIVYSHLSADGKQFDVFCLTHGYSEPARCYAEPVTKESL